MERDEEIRSVGANGKEEERGAGGKARKPPARKPAASPYARPPGSEQRRWISKLVDPACRLIAGGATRIFPSFFSKIATTPALVGPSGGTEYQGKWQAGEQGHMEDIHKCDLHPGTSKSTEVANAGEITNKLRNSSESSDFDLRKQDKKEEQSENNRISEIEQLVKGKKFSRDEVNHLMELLNSRAVDLPTVEQRKENESLIAKKVDKGLEEAHAFPKLLNEQKYGELNGVMRGTSTPLGQSKVRDEIGASPIEIARAYMDSLASEAGPSSKSMIQSGESTGLHGNEAAIKPYAPSPLPKSSTCWPGAVVQDAYVTPQSQRSRYGLCNFPRTPYSRTILSKSKSRSIHMQGDYNHISSTPLHQLQTTLYVQDKSRGDALEGGYGSVGPIRRIRHKVGVQSSSRKPAYFHSSLNGPLKRESSDFHEGFLPASTKSLEADGADRVRKSQLLDNKSQVFEVATPTVHMHSSLMAQKILEHIDRNPPTPKEKSAELKLATKWKNPESFDDANTLLSNENYSLLKLKDVGPYKCDVIDDNKYPRNDGQGSSHVILPRENFDTSTNIKNKRSLSSNMNIGGSVLRIGSDTRTSQNSGGFQSFSMKSTEEDAMKAVPSGDHSHGIIIEGKKPLSESLANKPVLPSISIKKPDSRWTFASDNSSGFTFPVSASSSAFSEPPTPSIVPLLSTAGQDQSKEKATEPSYSFGLKSSPVLVFSFPSTSSAAVRDDAGDIKFNFGSNDKERLSFSSFNKNGICS